ncbi:hypothetical protein ACFFJX_02240 [Pseudarcicella hirudinis]|uniref:hypothetical protein n=1 Tax=Pseudarcicella hirudinis TaxID=1079859 RepID=UPI0035EEE538
MSPVSSDLSVVYESTDMGGGKWTPDFTDTTSVDTTGGVLVCANGVRLNANLVVEPLTL